MRYVLIDEGAYPPEMLAGLPHNVAAGIFRLEQPFSPDKFKAALDTILQATQSEEYRVLRRLIAIWLRAVLKRNKKYPILLPELDDLKELRVMLSQRMEQWAESYMATGRMEGRMEGEARLLARLLSRRFGELPAWVGLRLNSASETELAVWSEAVLDAKALDEVFAEPPSSH